MKKICVYLNSMAPSGGIERVVSNLFNILSDFYEVTILTKDNEPSFYKLNDCIKLKSLMLPAGIDMHYSRKKRAYNVLKSLIQVQKSLKNFFSDNTFDYIYVVHVYNAIEVLLTKNKEKLLISEHGSYFGYNKVYTLLKRLIYPKAYKLIVPSKMDTEIYKKIGYPAEYFPHHNTYEVSQNPADVENNRIVLNVGRYTDDKRQIVLLKIWATINSEIKKEWKLYIVGSGENENILREYIKRNNLSDSVELIAPTTNIEEYYKKAAVFAFTSRFEGFGMVLLEAMSFGLPCISFDCPSGPRDVVVNGENGYLIENSNELQYAEKMIDLLKNSELREKFSRGAINTISKWDNNNITNQWRNLLI